MEVSLVAMKNAQASANSEDKSSAGDKYETSRAMSHIEKDMYAGQLAANGVELAQLLAVDCSRIYDTAATGSLVACTDFSFFISAGLGKINLNGKNIYLLSPLAPLARLLMGNKKGATIMFNDKLYEVIEIF